MQKTVFQKAALLPRVNGWREVGSMPLPYGLTARTFIKGPCRALVSQEPNKQGQLKWHLSISCQDRYPGWNEIKDARYALLPHEITTGMILPPPEEYVNIHPNCFHLHEIESDT
jgi:hypothetical protein